MEFTIKTKIKATAIEIYTSWLSSEGHTKMTGGMASISDKIGDSFSAWDGYIKGKNIVLEPNRRIVQSWRASDFEEKDIDSQIEILFSEVDGETDVTLIHTKLPESGAHYKKGWDDHYFQPMKAYFRTN